MANLEEKVKAFPSDEKKVEVIAKDEAFLNAVSGGTATPEIIAEKFDKAGLPLSKDEAKQVKEAAEKALSIPLEQLAEIELNNVSGGVTDLTLYNISEVGFGVEIAGAAGCLGLQVASLVCALESGKAESAGNESKSDKLAKASVALWASGTALAGVGIGGATAYFLARHALTDRVNARRDEIQRDQEVHRNTNY